MTIVRAALRVIKGDLDLVQTYVCMCLLLFLEYV